MFHKYTIKLRTRSEESRKSKPGEFPLEIAAGSSKEIARGHFDCSICGREISKIGVEEGKVERIEQIQMVIRFRAI
jgi:hypothetical protein